ncbi:hypothetical protein [Paractinoplanes lichenicola]|uniref:Uncharacterized protein n=1 Tax=Paractinoplanes lichenicola TaxID=2802976 RepID=A0ABS1VUJ3_9ACTN|nr:hypothetical protein [Actinoplanes lichenicola]MBL7258155.1 hypothetical protein [Actinoplanes lichenicola]
MNLEQAVVRLPYTANGVIRVGTVVSQDGDLYQVKWDNGGDEEVKLGDYEWLCPRGSLKFQSLVDPEALRKGFEADPGEFVMLALKEAAAPMTGKDLKVTVTALGITDEDYRRAWPTIRKLLIADNRVTVSGSGAAMTFQAGGTH